MSKRKFDDYSTNDHDHYYSAVVGFNGSRGGGGGMVVVEEGTEKSSAIPHPSSDNNGLLMDSLVGKKNLSLIIGSQKVSSMMMDDDETPANLLNMEANLPELVQTVIDNNNNNNNSITKKRKIEQSSGASTVVAVGGDSFEDLFFKAINNGDMERLLLLLQRVPSTFNVNTPNHIHPFKDQPALHIACNCGLIDFVKLLLEHFKPSLNINLENSKGSRSIHFAAYGGNLQILITLISHVSKYALNNSSPPPSHHDGQTTTTTTGQEFKHFIFQEKSTDIFITHQNARIIHEFVNSKTKDENQRTPLIIATEKGNIDAVKFLLALDKALREICPELQDATTIGTQGSYLPIHKAASRNNTEIIQSLLEHNSLSVNAKTSKKKYPLYFAVKRGATCVVEVLLKYGASTCEYTPSGKKLLHIAAFINNLDICKLLLEQPDCDLDANTNDGHPRTALHLAAKRGHCEIIKLLLSKGANVECVDYFGRYPIHVAASSGSIEATHLFAHVNGKDYINSKNSTGITCLHFACASGHTKMIPFLKSKGFNFHEAQDERCIRPIYVAAAQNQQNVVLELAKYYKKDINYINAQTGLSPLHIAIARDSFSAVEALIESGADIYQTSGSGMSAIALAKHKNNTRLQNQLNRIMRSD